MALKTTSAPRIPGRAAIPRRRTALHTVNPPSRQHTRELLFLCRSYQSCGLIKTAEQLPLIYELFHDLLDLLHASKAYLWLVDDSSAEVVCKYAEARQKTPPLPSSATRDGSLARWVCQHAKGVVV